MHEERAMYVVTMLHTDTNEVTVLCAVDNYADAINRMADEFYYQCNALGIDENGSNAWLAMPLNAKIKVNDNKTIHIDVHKLDDPYWG